MSAIVNIFTLGLVLCWTLQIQGSTNKQFQNVKPIKSNTSVSVGLR